MGYFLKQALLKHAVHLLAFLSERVSRLARFSARSRSGKARRSRQQWMITGFALALGFSCLGGGLLTQFSPAIAQSGDAVEQQEDAVIQEHALPRKTPQAPVVKPRPAATPRSNPPRSNPPRSNPADSTAPRSPEPQPKVAPAPSAPAQPSPAPAEATSEEPESSPTSQYVLQFNRSPVVGNALQLEGILSQARLSFTRPRHWQVASAKVILRFRHSPALYANRSNLTVRLNNSHLGSVPLNRRADEIGNVAFDIPAGLIQDYNTLTMQAQQHTSENCTDPTDPTLWTEILPDSQVILNYRPQDIALDFANYPYPFLDDLGLEPDRLAYLRPQSVNDLWLTAAGRFQAAASRLSNARPMDIRLVKGLDAVKTGERLVVIGTPQEQSALTQLKLPFAIKDKQVLDGNGKALPPGVGVLMLTTTQDNSIPVLVATGNDPAAVLKAVQLLTQPGDRQLATGQALLVNEVAEVTAPELRHWPGYLPPDGKKVRLGDLLNAEQQPFQDTTVNGLPVPPAVTIPLRALPDDQFQAGSSFTLNYSYSPNVDPRRSSVSVLLNGRGIGGERLTSAKGGKDSLTVELPPDLMTPTSNLAVQFITYPPTALACGEIPDQPMWGTVHADSTLQLHRTNITQFPDLRRLQTGFPLGDPQDLSQMSFVVPDQPSDGDIQILLQVSARMGRLSQANAVKLGAYLASNLPPDVRNQQHLVGIGLRDRFPLPEVFQSPSGLLLGDFFLRQQQQSAVQTLPDQAGMVQATVSPWHSERLLLGLTGQTPQGLTEIQQLFRRDDLFAKLAGDTVLVQRRIAEPSEYDPGDFQVTTLTQREPKEINRSGFLDRTVAFFQANWFLLPTGLILCALLAYGVSQLYLNRVTKSGEAQ